MADPLPLCEGMTGTRPSEEPLAAAVLLGLLHCFALLSLLLVGANEGANEASSTRIGAAVDLSLDSVLTAGAAGAAAIAAVAAAMSADQPAAVVAPKEAWLMRVGLLTWASTVLHPLSRLLRALSFNNNMGLGAAFPPCNSRSH